VRKIIKYYLFLIFLFLVPNISAQVIIVNHDNETSTLSKNMLRSIFAMRSPMWADGSPIHVFVLKDSSPIHTSFCKHLLGMFPYQLRRVWDRQVFSGTGIAPITVKSEQEMLEKVSQYKGGIGYISTDNNSSSVKILGDL